MPSGIPRPLEDVSHAAMFGGAKGHVVPVANGPYDSNGFDANRPRVVIVDPGEIGGGYELDMGQVRENPAAVTSALAKIGGTVQNGHSLGTVFDHLKAEMSATAGAGRGASGAPARNPEPGLPNALVELPQVAAVKVTFEIANGPRFQGLYPEVIVDSGKIVLVYDHSNPAQMVCYPPSSESLIAVHVDGVGYFLAYSTGIQFTHRNFEYYLLLIEDQRRE